MAEARQIRHGQGCAEFLSQNSDKLTPELLPEALAATQQIEDEYVRAEVFSPLAEKLTPELLPEALAVVRQIQKDYLRAQALSALANKLTPEFIPEALATALQIRSKYELSEYQRSKYDRTYVLSALTDKLTQMPTTQLYRLWENSLHALSLRTRPSLLSDITALTPVIFSLGGEEAIENIVIAIQDVSRWWR